VGLSEKLSRYDLETLLLWLSPEWIRDLARGYGQGDLVLGATAAYHDVRSQVRDYMRFVRHRNGSIRGLEMALILRNLGWIPGSYVHVSEIEPQDDGLIMAEGFWPNGTAIPGAVEVETGNADPRDVYLATIRAISSMLAEHPEWNRAVLEGKAYQRHTGHVMAVIKPPSVLVFDASSWDTPTLGAAIRRGMRGIVRANNHELVDGVTAGDLGRELLLRWAGKFITSTAGAMVSYAPNVPLGWSALAPNGVPLAFTLCRVANGRAWITLTADHRAVDGIATGNIYAHLEEEVPRVIRNP
jgi:hypothetical protein